MNSSQPRRSSRKRGLDKLHNPARMKRTRAAAITTSNPDSPHADTDENDPKTTSRPRRSGRNKIMIPAHKHLDMETSESSDGGIDNIREKSPTSTTAKPSSQTSPARKRSKLNPSSENETNNKTIEENIDGVVKRGRGRPRKYPHSPLSSPKATPKKKQKASPRTRRSKGTNNTPGSPKSVSPRKSARPHRKRSFDIEDIARSMTRANPNQNEPCMNNNNNNNCATTTHNNCWRTNILTELQRRVRRKVDPYGFFSRPVDSERDECPDYYDVVDRKDSICFDEIGTMIDTGKLKSIDHYLKLLKMVVKCARTYNTDEDNFVRKQADLIEGKAESALQFARDRWVEREEKEESERLDIQAAERRNRQKLADARSNRLNSRRRSRSNSASSDENYSYNGDVDLSKDGVSSRKSRHDRFARQERNDRPSRISSRLKDSNSSGTPPRSRRVRKNQVVYNDDVDSIGSLSDSDRLPRKDNESDDDDVDSGPIEGSDIPFCKPMLANSVMTPCNTREAWLELCPRLATVCNEAARRSTLRSNADAKRYEKPLSEIYIRERIEYDDPLDGFVVRTKAEPHHIQGFIIATKFTTWRKTFRWAVDTPAAMITPSDHRLHLTDRDGELTKSLQEAVREGPDSALGYKFPRICEISLLGGLGCGRALISRALSELRQSQKYDFVVLQSTKIAIPFYEKHGFVRVGAVTRFNDVECIPEVAYRHWSEIVNGEAVEASYMMARRLKTSRLDSAIVITKNPVPSDDERKEEILKALKSAHSLLSDVLTIRIGSVAYANSFREILSAAREHAISADDYHLVKVIDKARSEFTGSHFGKSKRILRSELRYGRSSIVDEEECSTEDKINEDVVHEQIPLNKEVEKPLADQDIVRMIDIGVRILVKGCEEENEEESLDDLGATVPARYLLKDDFFHVKVVVDGERAECESDDRPLLAQLGRIHKSSDDLIEAGVLAVENLKSFLCKRSKSGKRDEHCGVGDEIMLRVNASNGAPFWIDAIVKKRCKMRSDAPYYSGSNGYSVEWEDSGGLKCKPRVLDIRNRGVGKAWCTEMDWASFSVLPTDVLDSLLLGSKVNYPNIKGEAVEGMVTKRIGGGLDNELKFRVEIGRKSAKGHGNDEYKHEYLSAGAIREAIAITDANIMRTRRMLKSMKSRNPRQESEILNDDSQNRNEKKLLRQTSRKMNIESAEMWAAYRLKEYNLTQISEDEKTMRKQKCNKVDDCIIHLSTGIGAKDSKEIALSDVTQGENVNRDSPMTDKVSTEIELEKGITVCENDDEIESLSAEEKKDDRQAPRKLRRVAAENGTSRRRSTRIKANV